MSFLKYLYGRHLLGLVENTAVYLFKATSNSLFLACYTHFLIWRFIKMPKAFSPSISYCYSMNIRLYSSQWNLRNMQGVAEKTFPLFKGRHSRGAMTLPIHLMPYFEHSCIRTIYLELQYHLATTETKLQRSQHRTLTSMSH